MTDKAATTMSAPGEVYRRRRARLAAGLERPLVIFAGHAPARNYSTNPYPFRAASSYLYFGGPLVENAAWLIEPESDGDEGCTLLRPVPGPDDGLWIGEVPDDEDLADAAGLRREAVVDLDQMDKLARGREAAAIAPPQVDTLAAVAKLGLPRANDEELRAIINLRLRKDEHELAAMRRAAEVAMDAHRAAMTAIQPGRREADAAAAFHAVLAANECRPSFTPIVTVRCEVLHGQGHGNVMLDGAMLLIDAGAEEPGGYASDITRTVPVSAAWSPTQRQLYEMVERALHEATAACVPGRRYRDVHDLAARTICAGLVEAEFLKGNPDELCDRRAHALFFPHGVGHLIGLDVHDMEDFGDLAGYAPGRTRRPEFGHKFLRLDRDLEPGMAVTIEPGIYFVPAIWASDELVRPLADVVQRSVVDALLDDQFGGIRIENTICVRDEGGPEILSGALPTGADEVAACVGVGG